MIEAPAKRRFLAVALAACVVALLPAPAVAYCTCSVWEQPPVPTWTELHPAHTPTPRMHHRITYDAARSVAVLFGGAVSCQNRTPLADTWEFDGNDWHMVATPTSPPPRYHGALAFDSVRNVVVLFGGTDRETPYNDTWQYDGTNWTQLFPTVSPPGCSSTALAFDPDRGRIVARGKHNDSGDGSCPMAGQTWEFDGATWVQVFTAHQPPDSSTSNWQAFFVWDAPSHRFLYFVDMEVWAYDGADWAPVLTFSCGIEGIGFDAGRRAVLLSPVFNPPSPILFSTEWEWNVNGGGCSEGFSPTVYPPQRTLGESPLVYFAARGYMLLYGGFEYCTTNNLTDTWAYSLDSDTDGFADAVDCAPSDANVYPGAPQLCDAQNNDCSDPSWPTAPAVDRDGDGDGYRACAGDCNDGNALIHPGASEVCNGIDDNCNTSVDDDALGTDSDGDGIHNACDNCRLSFNPTQLDTDGDIVGNACDNCALLANPNQADTDNDQRGDACDNCPTAYNPFQDDFDSDRVGDACDNCAFDFNPTQSDTDHDNEGDRCDVNDGLIYVFSTDPGYVEWQDEVGPSSWNVYEGSLAILRSTGAYSQVPGSNPMAQRSCHISQDYLEDFESMPAAAAKFSLVTGVTGGVEGSLGTNSAGAMRPNANPCP